MDLKKYIGFGAALFIMLSFVLTGCKDDGFYYRDIPRIRLVLPDSLSSTDSLEYSFITMPTDSVRKEIPVIAEIMGDTVSYSRTASLEVVADNTSAPARLYKVSASVVIPAGKSESLFYVELERDSLLQDSTVQLDIQVVKSTDFSVGVNEQNHILIKWNDLLTKPDNWSSLQEFFGTFSLVKYRFMLNNAGVTEFDTTKMTWAELQNYKILLTNALDEYNAEHPGNPLRDEYGILVDFDN